MNLNKTFILGNLTRDPEVRSLPSGQQVASFGVATNRVWKNAAGEKQQQVEYHNVVVFGRLAEIAQQYLNKGKLILVEGRIQTRSWTGQDGSKKYKTEIICENFQMGPRSLDGKQPNSDSKPSVSSSSEQLETVEYPDENVNPDDIPF